MDTTKEYILQCAKAEEIQKDWDFTSEFNVLYDRVTKKRHLNVTLYVWGIKKNKSKYIWLPTQSQLQEMVKDKYGIGTLIDAFWNFCGNQRGIKTYDETMEQLWLAFVMKEKYQKIWDGGKWTKIP